MTAIYEKLTNNQSVTITLASLGSTSARQSTIIDNTTNQDIDAGLMVKLRSGASGTSSTGVANIYAFASADGGTNYTEGLGATDAAATLTSPPNVKLIGTVSVVANSTTYVGGPFSVAAAFGYLPGKWGVVVENKTGAVLDGSAGNFNVVYERVQMQSV